MRNQKAIVTALASVALTVGTQATTLTYPDFSGDVSGLQFNGSAARVGSVLRVTPANYNQSGSVFSKTAIALDNLQQFSTRFQFQITVSGGITDENGPGADGLAFVVQTVANTAGGAGGGIGYAGLSPSVGVEYDTYNNGSWDDNNGNHVGIDINGNIDSAAQANVLPQFNNDQVWTTWIDYNGSVLEVRLNQTGTRPASALLSHNVNLSSILGANNVYVGFTSGTGSAYGNHDILNWMFESTYKPIGGVPEAGTTLMLLGLGCLGIGGVARFTNRRK